ncbi:MAG: excinuclease ABC subunit UvrB [Alphaproteobacteria bacterium]|nr:excinuclease ABC subunit UvrB [Alphaproteobacteria bacterium]
MLNKFELESPFKPAGDQPEAIRQLINGLNNNEKHQVLLGVTGSGKTFTMANIIQNMQVPTLIITHNKTLVAQLYGEFKQFFPNNAVGYFVSYYDYYQPEAYLPASKTYIEKDLSINQEIDKLRLQATTQLLSGRKDVIIVASVSCIYGMGNPIDFENGIIRLHTGQILPKQKLLLLLVDALYHRSSDDFERGSFRVIGDSVDVHLPYSDLGYRIKYFNDKIISIFSINPKPFRAIEECDAIAIFPANLYVAPKEILAQVVRDIQDELMAQITYFEQHGKQEEAIRIKERVEYDLEMIKELGYCSGIENYSRFFDRRLPGSRPFCLLDYFPKNYLCFIDESHQTIPQINGMHGGDRSRKLVLVDYGFRLPSALDNRPQNYAEFENMINQVIYVSATPGPFELRKTEGLVVEQVVRPTGLLDPIIEVRPSHKQMDDVLREIKARVAQNERVLITTLTKKMAEELHKFLQKTGVLCQYIHSDVDTLERIQILRQLRLGKIDVLVGVNLLREGLDLPEVSLVIILDADKEGFLRDHRSLTQTAGRAARNLNGKVIFYADKITNSMLMTINETKRRREKQEQYNLQHHIVPKSIQKSIQDVIGQTSVLDFSYNNKSQPASSLQVSETQRGYSIINAENTETLSKEQHIKILKKQMQAAAKNEDFMEAARLRDAIKKLA